MRESAYSNKKVATAFVAVALVLSVGFFVLPVQQAHAVIPPTHQQILDAKTLADAWFNTNIKSSTSEVESTSESLIAEYQSIPFRITYSDGSKVRVGENVQNGFGTYTSKVFNFVEVNSHVIEYDLQFCTPSGFVCDAPRLHILVDFIDPDPTDNDIHVFVSHTQWNTNAPVSSGTLYLGSDSLGTVSASTIGNQWDVDTVSNGDAAIKLKSHRYTERHAVQLAAMYADILDDATLQTELETALTNDGYTIEKDIYAPLFDQGTQFDNNYLYQSGADGVYRDCYIAPAMASWAYEYQSKVCTVGVDTYITYSKTQDILVPMLWAVHLLNKGVAPDTDVSDGYRTWSPRDVAREAENWWISNGDIGIKSPFSSSHASSVRTSAFLILESVLASRGDATSDTYADKAAAALIQPRNTNGNVIRENEDGTSTTLYRPQHKGTWYTAWNGFNYVAKKSILNQMADAFNQIDEHPDIKPTNAESTILAMQALRTYDRFNYAGDTENVPE